VDVLTAGIERGMAELQALAEPEPEVKRKAKPKRKPTREKKPV
jgi:hypothetical protein